MSFGKIIGNNRIKKDLQETVKNNNISHSYLFIGQEGIGKKMFAKEFAKMILCLSENKACNECDSCIKFNSNNNPDFTVVEPDGNFIKIDQIREMQEDIYKKPIVSNKKVFIINDSDNMKEEAQNCLLKTLEEPPEYIVIILICANENKLLNTIKSRCLKIKFNNLDEKELIDYVEKEQIMQNPSNSLLAMCSGSLGKLIKINENVEEYNFVEKNMEDIINGRVSSIVKIFGMFEVLYKSKDIILDLLDYMMVITYEHIKKRIDHRGKYLNLVRIIEDTKSKLAGNTNYDMCIDDLLLKIWEELNENNSRG